MTSGEINETVGCLTRFAEAVIKTSSDSDIEATLNKIQCEIAFYCKTEAKYKHLHERYEENIIKINNASSPDEALKICNEFSNVWNDPIHVKEAQDARYKNLINLRGNPADETLMVIKDTQTFMDPLSRRRMVDPVKNSVCGHSYEKSMALQLIELNPRTRCPMMGCGAFIEKRNLVPDDDLRRQLEAASQDDSIEDASQLVVSLEDSLNPAI